MARVDIKSVRKTYDGANFAVNDVSINVPDGELVVFVGPSGCGKSTLLRMVAGLEDISEGIIEIDGREVNHVPTRERDIAMVFQDYALYPHKTVWENMAFGLQLRKTPAAEITRRVNDAAGLLRIEHLLGRKPAALSGGQRQRVAIGRAIVRNPKVFLFDEPLSNLDAQLRTEMRAEIKRLHHRLGATIIYVTHDQVEAMTLADKIAILHQGCVQQLGTPAELYARPGNQFVAGFMGSPPMNLLSAHWTTSTLEFGDGHRWSRKTLSPIPWADMTSMVVGIRPEHLILGELPDASLVGQGLVSMVEPLGAETLITLALGSQQAICRAPAGVLAAIGDSLTVSVLASHLHGFSSDTGLRC